LLFNFSLEYALRKVQGNKEGFKIEQVTPASVDDVIFLGANRKVIRKHKSLNKC
jgi:hypothetical protein